MYKTLTLLAVCFLMICGCSNASSKVLQTSFEEFKQGPLTQLKADYGTWSAPANNATIDSHYKTGKNCLRILGGTDNIAELALNSPLTKSGNYLTFWAERWTSRSPFKFRIEAFANGKWSEIYNGDKKIKTGRSFLSQVTVGPIDKSVKKFRFIASAPANSGLLIDDITLTKPSPMTLKSVTTVQKIAPAMIGKTTPILQIKVTADGDLNPLSLSSISVTTDGTDKTSDIDKVKLYYSGTRNAFSTNIQFGSSKSPTGNLTFTDTAKLQNGDNYFWVAYDLKPSADLLRKVDASCTSVTVADKKTKPSPASPPIKKRIAIALRDSGDDGSRGYRIPGLATTNKGTIIAVYDIRYNGMGDLPGHIDVGMSRSTDKGQTFEPMKVIMDMGEPHNTNGIGDPTVMVDKTTNTIWVAAVWSHGNRGWHGSRPGMTPDETGQFMLVKSTDDGKTWSKPINITPQIKNPKWYYLLQGPGAGITLRNGTIVFPAQFKDHENMPHSTIIYSTDKGNTWTIGTGTKSNTTEAQVVELNDGSLMLNMRDNRGGSRSVYTTKDMGKTWTVHPTSRSALPEPVCMASLIKFASTKDGDDRDILLFSNPNTKRGRTHITIKASTDQGNTWPEKHQKLIHEPGCAGYSCMTKIDENTVGILYEGGNTALLIFEKFNINEILQD